MNLRDWLKTKRSFFPPLLLLFYYVYLCRQFFYKDIPAGIDQLAFLSRIEYYSIENFPFYWVDKGLCGQVAPIYLDRLVGIFTEYLGLSITAKLLIFSLLLLSGFSMYFIFYRYTRNTLGSFCAALIFSGNQFILSNVAGGHYYIVFAYSLIPLIFYVYDKVLSSSDREIVHFDIIILSLLLVLGVTLTRFESLFYYGLLMGVLLIFHLPSKRLDVFVKKNLYILILSFLFGGLWFLPYLNGVTSSFLLTGFNYPVEDLFDRTLNLFNSLTGHIRSLTYIALYKGMTWEKHPILSDWAYKLIMSIGPIIAFSALIWYKNNKRILYFTVLALISVFLAKGPYMPFGDLYLWMYNTLPFFSSLRVANRWLMPFYFSISFLIGFVITRFSESFRDVSSNSKEKLKKGAVICLIITYMVLGNWVIISNGFLAWDIPKKYSDAYKELNDLNFDAPYSRVISIPFGQKSIDTKILLNTEKGWREKDLGSESDIFHETSVINQGSLEGYSSDFYTFLETEIKKKTNRSLTKIIGIFGGKYAIINDYPLDKVYLDDQDEPYYQHKFFRNQTGLKLLYKRGGIELYENEFWTPTLFIPQKYAIVVGGRETFTTLTDTVDFNLSQWGLLFADQLIRESGEDKFEQLLNHSDALIFVNSEPLDLAMLMLDNATRIKAAKYAYPSINAKEYWIGSDFATKMGMFVLNSRTLSTSGENNVSIPVRLEKDGKYEVWTRVVCDKNRGNLSLSIAGREVGSFIPYSPSLGIKWVKLGDVELSNGRHILLLQNKKSPYGTANDVDEIILVEPEELKAKLKETKELIEKSKKVVVIVEKNKLYNLIYKELEGEEVVIDDDQAKFWQNVNPAHVVLSDDSGIKARSENSLRINIHEPERGYYTLIGKGYDSLQDWSNKDYFVLWFKGQGTNTLFGFDVFFNDSYNDMVKFIIPDISSEWKRFVFFKSNPNMRNGEIDWSKVWLIRWGNNDKNITGDFYLDRITSGSFKEMEVDLVEKLDFPKRECQKSEFKDYLVFYSQKEAEEGMKFPEFFDVNTTSPRVNFTKINPTKYVVKVKAEEPFFLIFSDSYHPMWKAYINSEEIDSVISYSFINGFYINNTGEMDIKVEFIGQRYVWIGGIISVTSFAFALVYILFERRIKHRLGKKEED